jgi:hypothetical protein
MMTRLEQEVLEEASHYIPEIAKALSSIATELHEMNGHYPDIRQSAMGPGDDEDLPF